MPSTSSRYRKVTEEQIQACQEMTQSKNTKTHTKWGIKVLHGKLFILPVQVIIIKDKMIHVDLYIQSLKHSTLPFFRSFSVHKAFIHRSFSVHKAFTVHNSHYHSEFQWERNYMYFYREKMKKERMYKSGRKIKYKSAGLLFPQVQRNKNCRGSPVCYTQTRHAEFLKSLWKDRFCCWSEKQWFINY
jgi:hypothetical protein